MPGRPNDSCSRCGKHVWRSKTSRPEIICHDCRRTHSQPYGARDGSGEKVCDQCGDSIQGKNRRRNRFCSQACSAAYQSAHSPSPRKGRTCVQCGGTFNANNAGQLHCSWDCRRAYLDARREPKPPKPAKLSPVRTCRRCGAECPGMRVKWCSRRCETLAATERANVRVMDLYRLACEKGLGGRRWRSLLVGYIAERDGPKCGICRRRIDLTLKSGTRGSDLGPSIDHVVPRSHGGSDDLANLRLAHWGCNRARKAKGGNEQLALVG